MKKTVNIFLVILFNICLLWISIVTPALLLASNENFYKNEFRENGIYSSIDEKGTEKRKIIYYIGGVTGRRATFSDEQLDLIIHHIVNYLFTDEEDFSLVMNNVHLLDEGYTNNVDIFGEKAISHMADVKALMSFAKWIAIVAAAIMLAIIIYFIKTFRKNAHSFFAYSKNFYLTLLGIASIFVILSFLGSTKDIPFSLKLWQNMHYLIFPFQPQKISGSILYDTLTCLLTTELFISAVLIIVAVIISTVFLVLLTSFLIKKYASKFPK